jgi:O-antigen/teichoic acid export membrane protein
VSFLVWTTALSMVVGLGLNLLLIPSMGALGAAVATSGSLVLQNILHHWGMHRSTGVELLRWKYLRVYLDISLAIGALLLIHRWLAPPLFVDLSLVALAAILLLRLHRKTMDIANVFPELRKVPVLGALLGIRDPA